MCVPVAVNNNIIFPVVVLLVALIFLRFASVVMCVSTTVSFAVAVVRITSERIKVRARVFTEVITDLVLDVVVITVCNFTASIDMVLNYSNGKMICQNGILHILDMFLKFYTRSYEKNTTSRHFLIQTENTKCIFSGNFIVK